MGITRGSVVPDMLPSHVRDIGTARCLFCPYGAGVEPGDRLYVYDEKTVFGRQQRERLVEIKAVKQFRSTGRVITLDLAMISPEEAAHIAQLRSLPAEEFVWWKVDKAVNRADPYNNGKHLLEPLLASA